MILYLSYKIFSMQLSKKEVKKALEDSTKDGLYSSASDSILATFTTPFALALGASDAAVGLVNSIPKFFSYIFQPIAGKLIELSGKRKTICINYALLARFSLIFAAILPLIVFKEKILFLTIILSFYGLTANFSGTAWASWIADFVPEKIRGRYFGRRNTIAGFAAFLVTLVSGWVLGITNSIIGFTILFLAAVLFGAISIYYLRKIPEPVFEVPKHKGHIISFHFKKFLKEMKGQRNFSNFVIHRALFIFAVYLASPFFVVYMLRSLDLGYFFYSLVVGIEAMTWIVMEPYWGKIADRFGDRNVLIACSLLAAFYPVFWFFINSASDFYLIVIASMFSGFAWAGIDLAFFNYLLDSSPPERRPVYIANYKLLIGMALFLGPLTGGFLAQSFQAKAFFNLQGLQILFLISFILRLLTVIPAFRLEETRLGDGRRYPVRDIFWKVVAIYPAKGVFKELEYATYCLGCWEKRLGKRFKGMFRYNV